MWPNGDMTESEAYRASRRFVTHRAQRKGCSAARSGAEEKELSCRRQPWTGTPGQAPRTARPRAAAALAGSSCWSRARCSCWPSPSARAWPTPPGRTRPRPPPTPAPSPRPPPTTADQATAAQPGRATQAGTATKPDTGTNSKSNSGADSGTSTSAPVLPDGTHTAYITKVDQVNDRIVVDVVQVFQGDQAVKEAIADGKPRSEAQYLTTWVRNVNPRLRTLPLASGVVVKLWDSCEGNASGHNQLTTLSANARDQHTYYYDLTVSHGKVQRIQEQLAINAC
jgi:hypothetical protein